MPIIPDTLSHLNHNKQCWHLQYNDIVTIIYHQTDHNSTTITKMLLTSTVWKIILYTLIEERFYITYCFPMAQNIQYFVQLPVLQARRNQTWDAWVDGVQFDALHCIFLTSFKVMKKLYYTGSVISYLDLLVLLVFITDLCCCCYCIHRLKILFQIFKSVAESQWDMRYVWHWLQSLARIN